MMTFSYDIITIVRKEGIMTFSSDIITDMRVLMYGPSVTATYTLDSLP